MKDQLQLIAALHGAFADDKSMFLTCAGALVRVFSTHANALERLRQVVAEFRGLRLVRAACAQKVIWCIYPEGMRPLEAEALGAPAECEGKSEEFPAAVPEPVQGSLFC